MNFTRRLRHWITGKNLQRGFIGAGHGGGSTSGYSIANSVRFRASASASFSRTPGVAGNSKLLCGRFRIKRGTLGALQVIASAGTSSIDRFYFDSSDRLCLDVLGTTRLVTTAVYRDPSAHYVDVGFQLDVANGTAALRAKILINGTEVGSYSTDTRSSITNTNTNWNAAVVHYIGKDNAGNYFDGVLSEPSLVDGSTSIAYSTTDTNGVPIPSQPSATWGTCGFYLKFNDGTSATTLGYDRSGNGNNWTPSGISTTAGVTYDWLTDTPTNNYAVLNPIYPSAASISYANLRSGTTAVRGTINANDGTGHYWEVTAAGSAVTAGVVDNTTNTNTTTVTANKVFGFRLTASGNLDYINITDAGSWTSITTGLTDNRFPYGTTAAADWNFGQRPFVGTASGTALCTASMPSVAIPKGSAHFQALTDTGANIKTTTEAAFTYLIETIKDRANSNNWQTSDSVVTNSNWLHTNDLLAQAAYSAPSGNSVGYAWKLPSAGSANNNGSVTATVAANTAAGVSVAKFQATGSGAITVGHGLTQAPEMVVWWSRDVGDAKFVYHKYDNASPLSGYLRFDSPNAFVTQANVWDGGINSSTVSIGSFINPVGTRQLELHCFHSVPGYSKFGSYVGNGNADGPYVHCGFRPRYVLVKAVSGGTGFWMIFDTVRNAYNVTGQMLYADGSAAEATAGEIDITANGFKLRNTSGSGNTSGWSYIFAAFAESPFGGSNVSPSCAR